MRIGDIIEAQQTAVSFEFFPPKSERGWERLFGNLSRLVPLHPSFVSVTYGAGGSTRERTHQLLERLRRETELTTAAHLTCVGSSRDEMARILERYTALNIRNILALRGDLPEDGDPGLSDFAHAADLVAFIRKRHPLVHIGVAGYPEGHPDTHNRLDEIDHLKAKVDAGADYIVTQMFFDNRDFHDFRERCDLAGIDVPIVAGIMPVTSRKGMRRMAGLARRSRFPGGLLRAVDRAQGEDYVKRVGVHWAAEQVRDLIDHDVAGIHLYTLNNSDATLQVCKTLGLRDFAAVSGPSVDAIRAQQRRQQLTVQALGTDI